MTGVVGKCVSVSFLNGIFNGTIILENEVSTGFHGKSPNQLEVFFFKFFGVENDPETKNGEISK